MGNLDIACVLGLVIGVSYDDKKKLLLLKFENENYICIKCSEKVKYKLLKEQCYKLGVGDK